MKRLMYLMIFSIVSIMLTATSHAKTIVTDGLVSYWTFDDHNINDDTVKDVWGENNATIFGNPEFVRGIEGDAIRLDGFGDYVNLTNLGDFGKHIETSTFEAWVKTNFKGDWMTLFKVIDPVSEFCDNIWGLDLNRTLVVENRNELGFPAANGNQNDRIDSFPYKDGNLLIYFGSGSGGGCGLLVGGFPYQVTDGDWHHLVYVMGAPYTDEFGVQWYETALVLDGVWQWKTRSKTINQNDLIPFTQSVYLGAGNKRGKAEGYYKGLIDEVRIYNRPLTHDEVIGNYEAGNPLSVEPTQKLPTVWGALKTRR